jgi:hypothetical protein
MAMVSAALIAEMSTKHQEHDVVNNVQRANFLVSSLLLLRHTSTIGSVVIRALAQRLGCVYLTNMTFN